MTLAMVEKGDIFAMPGHGYPVYPEAQMRSSPSISTWSIRTPSNAWVIQLQSRPLLTAKSPVLASLIALVSSLACRTYQQTPSHHPSTPQPVLPPPSAPCQTPHSRLQTADWRAHSTPLACSTSTPKQHPSSPSRRACHPQRYPKPGKPWTGTWRVRSERERVAGLLSRWMSGVVRRYEPFVERRALSGDAQGWKGMGSGERLRLAVYTPGLHALSVAPVMRGHLAVG
jgi:hypothetical protein